MSNFEPSLCVRIAGYQLEVIGLATGTVITNCSSVLSSHDDVLCVPPHRPQSSPAIFLRPPRTLRCATPFLLVSRHVIDQLISEKRRSRYGRDDFAPDPEYFCSPRLLTCPVPRPKAEDSTGPCALLPSISSLTSPTQLRLLATRLLAAPP